MTNTAIPQEVSRTRLVEGLALMGIPAHSCCRLVVTSTDITVTYFLVNDAGHRYIDPDTQRAAVTTQTIPISGDPIEAF